MANEFLKKSIICSLLVLSLFLVIYGSKMLIGKLKPDSLSQTAVGQIEQPDANIVPSDPTGHPSKKNKDQDAKKEKGVANAVEDLAIDIIEEIGGNAQNVINEIFKYLMPDKKKKEPTQKRISEQTNEDSTKQTEEEMLKQVKSEKNKQFLKNFQEDW